MNYEEFAKAYGLRAIFDPADDLERDPFGYMRPQFPEGSSYWMVTITRQGAPGTKVVVPWAQGPAVQESPTLADVLQSLANDIAIYAEAEDWAAFVVDTGYADTGSVEALRQGARMHGFLYQLTGQLAQLLGDEGLDTLLFEVSEDGDEEE